MSKGGLTQPEWSPCTTHRELPYQTRGSLEQFLVHTQKRDRIQVHSIILLCFPIPTRGQWPYILRSTRAIKMILFDLKFESTNIDYPANHVQIAFKSHFGGLCCHGGLQMASIASEVELL